MLINWGGNNTIEYAEAVLDAGKKVGWEIIIEKFKYMFVYRHETAGQYRNTKIASKFFDNVGGLKS
jgi:hypothetical protein